MEKHEFKPKEWVLVRDDKTQKWKLDIFSHFIDETGTLYPYICIGNCYSECIPYEGNEHLLGTSKPAGAPMELDGWKVGDKVEVKYCWDKEWYPGEIVRINPQHTSTIDGESMPYRVKAKCFATVVGALGEAWCAARQLRKPEEKPEEEFKFGQWVRAKFNGRWMDAIFLYDDGTDTTPIRVAIANKFGDVDWVEREDVRFA